MWKISENGQARSKKTWRPRYPCEWQVVCHRAVSEVFVKDNKLSAFYGKQPSNDRELEESDMFIIIMAELDDRSNTHVSQGNSDCHVYHRRMRMSNR